MPTRPEPPPRTAVVLVRHGLTPTTGKVLPGRAPGLHLADEGKRQAALVAERIAGLDKVAAVYSSPLERARETAAPVARALGIRTKIERGLIECDFGDWTGARLSSLSKQPDWRVLQRHPSGFRFPGGESLSEMASRARDAIERLVRSHKGATVVAVSHADPIKAAVADAVGTHLDLFQRICISPCSVTVISYVPEGPEVLTVNNTGSLSGLGL